MTPDPALSIPVLRAAAPQDRRKAVTLFILAITIISAMDALTKLASGSMSTPQIVWGRYVGQCIATLLIIGPIKIFAGARSKVLGQHIARALFLFVANFAFMASLRYLPLAEANVVAFASPLLLTALSYPVLGEHVGTGRWLAVIVGFAGVMVVLQPGTSMFQWASTLPLLMAVCAALYHIMTPVVARVEDPAFSIYVLSIFGAAGMSVVVPWFWTTPDLLGWVMLLALGPCGVAGHILIIRAFAHAPASMLAVLFYLHLVWATIYGWFLFGDIPTMATMIGGTLIITSGIYVYRSK